MGIPDNTINQSSVLPYLKLLGGVVSAVTVDNGASPVLGGVSVGALSGHTDTPKRAFPLSTLHISPFIEYSAGASLLKVSKAEPCDAPIGGMRGAIKGFSFASRRRLMHTVAKIQRDAELPDFVTITYPNEFPSALESKKHIDKFIKRLKRAFPGVGGIWKLEPQQRGAPHYHMLVWGADTLDLMCFVVRSWFEIAGNGDERHLKFHQGSLGNEPCVQKVRSLEGVMRYASKYLAKTFDVVGWDETYTGRFWAVFNRQNIPFGEQRVYAIPLKKAQEIMRYQRRFAKLRSRNYKSLTTFCDADQWVENLLEVRT